LILSRLCAAEGRRLDIGDKTTQRLTSAFRVAEPPDATDVIAFEEFGRPGRRVFGPRRPEPANRNGAPDRRAPN
jgi:hypothetical protein